MKIKCVQSEALFIVGYEMSAASPVGFGSLVLAAYRDRDLVHVGSVGTGSRQAEAIRLRKMLIAEIELGAWSSDGKLRHPSYKGLARTPG